jgi:uncharacterized lipoprotein NlpE involved in copper resistance
MYKKLIISLSIGGLVLVGCANKTVSKEDKCLQDRNICEATCLKDYPQKNWKYKACISKCYTVYGACKTGKTLKKGYEKTKEYIEEKLNKEEK